MPDRPHQPRNLSNSSSAPALGNAEKEMSARPGHKGSTASSSVQAGTSALALYSTPSYSSLYIEPEDLEPGPGSYEAPEGLGFQHHSNKESFPSMSLTAKHDKSWSKVMITKDHLSAMKARGTPGPGTYQPSLVPSQSRVRFGTSKRGAMSDLHFKAPGPIYEVRGAPDDAPYNIRIGKANRFAGTESLSSALGSTGPGMYESVGSIDGNRLAKSFGASHRAYDRVRFPGSEKEFLCKASPGPGAMHPFQNSGKACPFGRAARLPTDNLGKRAPGPGAYDQNVPAACSRAQSCYSFGRPAPRGRVNWKQMGHLSNTTWGYN